MCRLALLNNDGIRLLEKNLGGINELFEHLENAYGGHGNGCAIFYKGGKVDIKKGVKLKNKNISKEILKNIDNIEWVMYHTRLASVSGISDKNCHPYSRNGKVLMMNGTENMYNFKNGMTDTENILRSLKNSNIPKITNNLKSVFVGFDKKLFITKGKGDLMLIKRGNALIFSSEFPESYFDKIKIYESPKKWEQGNEIILKNLERCNFKSKCYMGYLSIDQWEYEADKFYQEMKRYYEDLELCRKVEKNECVS